MVPLSLKGPSAAARARGEVYLKVTFSAAGPAAPLNRESHRTICTNPTVGLGFGLRLAGAITGEGFPTPAEEDVHAVPLPRAGEEISIPIPEPVVAVESIAGPPITEIPRDFPLYPPSSPTTSSPVGATLTLSMTSTPARIPLPESIASRSVVSYELPVTSVRSVPPPLPGPSPVRLPETLLMSVTESTPSSLTPSSHPANPRAPPSPSIRECLWARETDDIYESSILAIRVFS
jgi:hypothetical protein